MIEHFKQVDYVHNVRISTVDLETLDGLRVAETMGFGVNGEEIFKHEYGPGTDLAARHAKTLKFTKRYMVIRYFCRHLNKTWGVKEMEETFDRAVAAGMDPTECMIVKHILILGGGDPKFYKRAYKAMLILKESDRAKHI